VISYQKPQRCYQTGVMTRQVRTVHIAGGNFGLCGFDEV